MDETQAVKDDLPRPKYTHVNYIFPCLVYVLDKLNSGELDRAEFEAVFRRNVEEHDHKNYRIPEDFFDMLPHQVNKVGWKIFEIPRLIAEQRAAAAERREQKAAAAQDKAARTASKPHKDIHDAAKTVASVSTDAATKKKKIIVVRKKTE